MKLLLLKVLLQRRARDEGFTLPMVIALGLVLILLGAINITSANEENINAISDNQKSKALAIAEVGVARYRQLLDNNRMLTVYSSNVWSGVAPNRVDNTCDINTSASPYDPDVTNINYFADTSQWHPVNDGTGNIGQYRIVSYVYDIDGDLTTNNDNQFAPNDDNGNPNDLLTFNNVTYDPVSDPNGYNPRGILTIKSQATDGSEAQVEVEIPIRINENDMTNLAPALWIGDSSIALTNLDTILLDGNRDDAANSNVDDNFGDGNIVISKPATGTTEGCDDPFVPSSGNANRIIYDPRPLPTIIADLSLDPDPTIADDANTLDDSVDITNNPGQYVLQVRGENNQEEDMLLLGAKETTPTDHKIWRTDSNGFEYFFYKANGVLNVDDGQKIATDGQSRVVLYVDNNINLTGNASLQAGSAFTSGYKSVGLQVYVNGTQQITINPNGGTVKIKGLIHAPDSVVNITGGGTVEIEGAVWVKNWNNTGGAEVTIIPDNAGVGADPAYQHYLGTDNRAARPITNAPTDWEVQEVDPN